MKIKRPKTEGELYSVLFWVLVGVLIVTAYLGIPLWIDIYEQYLKK